VNIESFSIKLIEAGIPVTDKVGAEGTSVLCPEKSSLLHAKRDKIAAKRTINFILLFFMIIIF
jgi:hypothetical protein